MVCTHVSCQHAPSNAIWMSFNVQLFSHERLMLITFIKTSAHVPGNAFNDSIYLVCVAQPHERGKFLTRFLFLWQSLEWSFTKYFSFLKSLTHQLHPLLQCLWVQQKTFLPFLFSRIKVTKCCHISVTCFGFAYVGSLLLKQ